MKYDYDNPVCTAFVAEVESKGFEVEHYRGRFFWEGPAVRCDISDYPRLVRATSMTLQHDSMGLGMIVYPVASGKLRNN